MKFKLSFNKVSKVFLSKYIIISIIGYSIIFFGLYVFVDILNFSKSISFLVIYAFNYSFLYLVQLIYLFKKKHKPTTLIRFLVYILSFYLLVNILFNILTYFDIQYLISTAITVIILFPLRLLVLKKVVYKD
jgi:hypothetical protein